MRSPEDAPEESPHNPLAAATPQRSAGRRKGTPSQPWLVVSDSGKERFDELGKHSIMRRTGIPARDLRLLDPLLSYPSTILGRERAIVLNLEHIKAIITATEVLIPNFNAPTVAPFVHDLQSRLSSPSGAPHLVAESRNQILLPFEFRVLEICLESSYRRLEAEALTLEQEAYPALDEMTSKISTLNLEHVRSIKSRLVAVSWHVQTVRDELEHLLDDDNDMAEMYLTKKLAHQHNGESSSRVKVDNDAFQLEEDRHEDFKDQIESSHGNLPTLKPNVQELEMLLETYFEQMDGTLNKLSRLRDYVDITEDCVKIMQDEKQNQLLEVGVMLSIGTVVVTAGVVVVGIFGQNIHIKLYDVPTYAQFWETTFGTIGVCLILYILAIGLAKRSGLLR
ncbi:magnesium transporter MRS2-F-like isoform X2 [Phoenix dactylifera]|uniref:Magnesium transporter n=1 Tax=Phoenix dactylifera TaxID=42345 RepID=A0A8B8J3D3_PHODC|nr:magnesium transporter MRS2-F-like isoform X2 [Phoenix dactylifera]XP_038988661.1 magnesium transporter MRS2-F-like isoform X2 [Phoenix dactylifera]